MTTNTRTADADERFVEYVPAPPGKHVLVTMPDGYRVWPDEDNEPRVYFCLLVKGRGEHGEPVTVRGMCIARVQPATTWPKPNGGSDGPR